MGVTPPPSATVATVVPAVMVAQVWGTSTPVQAAPAVTVAAVVPSSVMAVMVALAVEVALALPASLAEHGAGLVSADEALADADVVVALVAHRSFRRVAPAALDGKRVVDACGLWNRAVP